MNLIVCISDYSYHHCYYH